MVPPRGIAPRSPAYRAGALLLSYGGRGKWWLFPVSRRTLPAFNGPLICLSSTAVDPPCGIAPQSAGYKAAALLLSYGGIKDGRAPRCRPGCLLVPSEADCCLPRARMIESLEMDGGGLDRTGAWAAYEAAAFPLGYPAVEKWWVVPVTLRRRPIGRLFYRQLTVFT